MGNDQSRREQNPTWPIMMTRVVCKFTAVPEVVVWDHGRKNKDNIMIIWHVFIFNYVEFAQGKLRIARDTTMNDYLCCKGVKGAKFGPIFHTQFVDKWHVWFVGLCVDGSANYSSQVLHVAYLPISGPYFSRCLFLKGIFEFIVSYGCNYS